MCLILGLELLGSSVPTIITLTDKGACSMSGSFLFGGTPVVEINIFLLL